VKDSLDLVEQVESLQQQLREIQHKVDVHDVGKQIKTASKYTESPIRLDVQKRIMDSQFNEVQQMEKHSEHSSLDRFLLDKTSNFNNEPALSKSINSSHGNLTS